MQGVCDLYRKLSYFGAEVNMKYHIDYHALNVLANIKMMKLIMNSFHRNILRIIFKLSIH